MTVKDEEPEIVLEASGWAHAYVPKVEEAQVSGAVKYAITGKESQIVSVALDPGDSIKGEPGSMMYLSPGITQDVSCDGCCERLCAGEECFVMNFTSDGSNNKSFVALTPNFPTAKVVPVDMGSPHVSGRLIAQQGAFMASYGDVHVGMSLDCNFMRCCCAGTGLVRQKLEGNGTAFLAATGTIVQKVLEEGETIIADTNCILAFAETCKLDLRRTGGVLGMVGGGEGIFNTTLTGPGLVIVQTMNETIFREALVANKIYRR